MCFNWNIDNEKVLANLARTHTMKEAAKIMGAKFGSIQSRAQMRGISFRKLGANHHTSKVSTEDVELIRQLSEAGLTSGVIAEKFDVSGSYVRQVVNYKVRAYG